MGRRPDKRYRDRRYVRSRFAEDRAFGIMLGIIALILFIICVNCSAPPR